MKSSRQAYINALGAAYLMAPEESSEERLLGHILRNLINEDEFEEVLAQFKDLEPLSPEEVEFK